jgi:membrane protein DedA with SNARE-associated domain
MKPNEKILFGVIGVFLSIVIWMSISEFYFPQVTVPKSLHLIVDVVAIIGVGVGVVWIIQSKKEKN